MDLLEYQGKQLFARHGVPVPPGEPATTVDEAVAAADEIGYPCVVKAQVLIGGRGKAGGIKLADGPRRGRASTPTAILGMDIRGHTVHEVWIEAASDIAAEYYASIVFDRAAKAPLVHALHAGRHGHRGGRRATTRTRSPRLHVDPLLGFQDFHGRRLAFEAGVDADVVRPRRRAARAALRRVRRRGGDARRGQPADRHARPRGHGARREGHARRQRALPPPRQRRAAQPRAARTRRSRWRTSAG